MIHEPIQDADQPSSWDYLPTEVVTAAGRSVQKLFCEGENALAFVHDGIVNKIAIELD